MSETEHDQQLSKKQQELAALYETFLSELSPGKVTIPTIYSLAPVSESLMLRSENVKQFIKRWWGKTSKDIPQLYASLSSKEE